MERLFYLDGADGTGKSTLANAIAEKYKASIIHCSFHKDWDMKVYHSDMLTAARVIRKYQPVVLDRWAVSAYVYGKIFQDGEPYDVKAFIKSMEKELQNTTWIYCRNGNVIENHQRNLKDRVEMFDDMTGVSELFEEYIKNDTNTKWLEYDFEKIDMYEFLGGL